MKTNDHPGTLTLAHAQHGELALSLHGNTHAVSIIACSPDGDWIIGNVDQNTVARWQASTGDCAVVHPQQPQAITSLAFSSDSTLYVSACGASAQVWNLNHEEAQVTLVGHDRPIHAILFDPLDRSKLATCSGDTTVKIWDTFTGETLHVLTGHTALVNSLNFSRDGKRLLSGGADERVIVWDVNAGNVILNVWDSEGVVWSIASSNDGTKFVSCSDEGTSQICSLDSKQALATLGECNGPVVTVRFSPDDSRVLAVCKNPAAVVYNALTGQIVFDVETEKADFSPDGKLLAGYWKDNLVRVWDATDGAEVKTLELPSEDLHALVFTCDSKRLVTSSGTQIIVWDIVN